MSEFTDDVAEEILMTALEENLKADSNGVKLREYIDKISSSKLAVEKQLAKGCSSDKKVVLEKLKTAWEVSDYVVRSMHERLGEA
jgi:hypothetical protein